MKYYFFVIFILKKRNKSIVIGKRTNAKKKGSAQVCAKPACHFVFSNNLKFQSCFLKYEIKSWVDKRLAIAFG